VAEISNFTDREIKQYEANMLNRYDYEATIAFAKEQGETRGEARGKEEGKREGFFEIARNMLGEGMKPALVARYTKLPLKTVKALR
jgi:predicted transposase/invertase (TIGR01784 family)